MKAGNNFKNPVDFGDIFEDNIVNKLGNEQLLEILGLF